MATPIWFSGSSPDAAFAREDAWRRERTNVLEGDRASRAQAEAQSWQAFFNNQQREDQLREIDLSRNQRAEEVAMAQQNNMRNFFAGQAERASDKAEQRPLMEATIAELNARTKSMNPLFKVAQSAAENGLITDPKEAAKQFSIPLDTAKALHTQSKMVQQQIDKEDAELTSAASQLTRYMAARNALKTLGDAPKGGMFWDSQATKDAKAKHVADAAEQERIISQLQKRADYLLGAKGQPLVDRLETNPDTGAYIYNPPPRPWRARASTTATGTAPAFFSPPPTPTASTAPAFLATPPQMPSPSMTNTMPLRPITREVAIQFLRQANGNREVARRLARDAGFSF